MLLIDTSGLLSALFPDQRYHEPCASLLRDQPGPFILSPFVLAESDYLISKLAGVDAAIAFLEEIAREAYQLASFNFSDTSQAVQVVRTYRSLGIGLTDASLMVLSSRYRCRDILTLDERHFRAMTTVTGTPFRLLPADL